MYDYEKILKEIYKHELGKEPDSRQRFDFVPLRERRDYGEQGHDIIEKDVLEMMQEGKEIPKDLLEQLKDRLKDFPARKSSVIDIPRKTLCPFVWELKVSSPVLIPKVKTRIVSDLFRVLHLNFCGFNKWVSGIAVTGSIATNQYNFDTDIDVNVAIDYDVFRKCNPCLSRDGATNRDIRKVIREKVYTLNGENVAGDHPVKYFVIGKGHRLESDYVYDVMNDKWLEDPKMIPMSFDPDKVFKTQKTNAKKIIKTISQLILKIKFEIEDLIRLEKSGKDVSVLKNSIQRKYENLENIQEQIKSIRKIRFLKDDVNLLGYGLSKNWEENNVVYKYLERYHYNKPLKVLMRVLDDEELQKIQKEAVIKRCPKKNLTDDRPVSEQQWCLFDSKGERLLGRHPTKEKAKAHERAVQYFKHK